MSEEKNPKEIMEIENGRISCRQEMNELDKNVRQDCIEFGNPRSISIELSGRIKLSYSVIFRRSSSVITDHIK